MYQALIFDFDYTLGDSTKGIEISINYAFEKMGLPLGKTEEIKKTIGLTLKDTYATLTDDEDEVHAEMFAGYFREKADEVMAANTELYLPVKDILWDLKKQGCKIGIVTTKFHYRIDQILEKFYMSKAVDIIVGGEDVKVEKPDPEGLLYAIEYLKLDKRDVLYVGDSIVDAKTAERAGVDFAGVLTGTTRREEFYQFKNVHIAENLYGIYEFSQDGGG